MLPATRGRSASVKRTPVPSGSASNWPGRRISLCLRRTPLAHSLRLGIAGQLLAANASLTAPAGRTCARREAGTARQSHGREPYPL